MGHAIFTTFYLHVLYFLKIYQNCFSSLWELGNFMFSLKKKTQFQKSWNGFEILCWWPNYTTEMKWLCRIMFVFNRLTKTLVYKTHLTRFLHKNLKRHTIFVCAICSQTINTIQTEHTVLFHETYLSLRELKWILVKLSIKHIFGRSQYFLYR